MSSQHQGCVSVETEGDQAMTASILVVDDEPAIQDILTWSLAAEGYRVATAGSGEEALTRVEEQDFDVIVTDIVMPGLHGLEGLERSRVLNPRTSSNVLITGESGVGKDLVARAIHAASSRHDGSFIPVNCGAIPETLLESQLFGHVRGAFTTAVQANPGLFVTASHGTLFLDEIGELPLPLQVKLLRVIEDKGVLPVGGTRPVPVDARIIASTNRDLGREVEARRFREDLFYRLNVVHLTVPPLRERRGDIPILVDHLVDRLNARLGMRCLGVERDALWSLIGRPWRGHGRELENEIGRASCRERGEISVGAESLK